MAEDIHYTGSKSVSSYLKKNIESRLKLHEVTLEQVSVVIDELAPKDSCGVDRLSTKLLKKLKPVISEMLWFVINQSINTGIFPDLLKVAIVTPIYKEQNLDIHRFNSYRPISLLPCISKVFEKLIYKQVDEYFNKNQLFLNSQYGFRKQHSTEFASLELVDRISKDLDKKKSNIHFLRPIKSVRHTGP